MTMTAPRVLLPFHLQTLAGCGEEVMLADCRPASIGELITALEQRYPGLSGAIVDPHTGKRRPLLRFFACKQDLSFTATDAPLPEAVLNGSEPFLIGHSWDTHSKNHKFNR